MKGYERDKTRRVIQFLLFFFVLIGLKVWHLCFIQREERLSDALKPKRKTIVESAQRGEIRDRFGKALALNRIRYDAAIYYNQILQVPSRRWKRGPDGKKVRIFPRREYIKDLSQLLAKELDQDPERIEDLIHSRAALFPHVPFIIKENISEEQYFRLRMQERRWLALHAQCSSERYYPNEKVASNILGYLGAMNSREYWSIARELSEMQQQMELGEEFTLEKEARYKELKEKAYTIHDLVGKTGIESRYEKELRGFYGKKTYEVDVKGNFLRGIGVEKEPTPGKCVTLSLSLELQEFCEALLAQDERIREGRSLGYEPSLKKRTKLKQPWIKGGAVVVMDPRTGEVLACAGHPRFDPNHFIPSSDLELKREKIKHVHQWLESSSYVSQIWEGKIPLFRDRYSPTKKKFWTEQLELQFDTFLKWILPPVSPIQTSLENMTVAEAIELQENVEAICYHARVKDPKPLFDVLFPSPENITYARTEAKKELFTRLTENSKEVSPLFEKISPHFSSLKHNGDKLFLIDLVRLFVYSPAFSDELIEKVGHLTLPSYHMLARSVLKTEALLKEKAKELFHTHYFKEWRKENFKEYLAQMRESEKERKTYARPYLDYLNRKERLLFDDFYKNNKASLFLGFLGEKMDAPDELAPYFPDLMDLGKNLPASLIESFELLKTAVHVLSPSFFADFFRTVRHFDDLDRPLYTRMRYQKEPLEKHLAASFYPHFGFSHSRSYAFQQACPLGSIFKIVTAYEALRQHYIQAKKEGEGFDSSLFQMIDKVAYDAKAGGIVVGYSLDQKPYPRFYKGGRLPKSYSSHVGDVDLIKAIEQSSNPYFSLLASEMIESPDDLIQAAQNFSFGKKTGLEIPGEFTGSLPKDLHRNRTGLYSFAIGQHSLVATPLQTAVFLSALANQGKVFRPKIVRALEGEMRNASSHFLLEAPRFPLEKELSFLGIHFPLFTESLYQNFNTYISIPDQVLRTVVLPDSIRNPILEGMDRVVSGTKGSARASVIKNFLVNPPLLHEYLTLRHKFVGKTSTAEIMHQPNQNPSSKALMYKHIWFGGISFKEEGPPWDEPELVIVVFLRYGDGGKEAVPIASQVVKKWKEIQDKNKES